MCLLIPFLVVRPGQKILIYFDCYISKVLVIPTDGQGGSYYTKKIVKI